MMQTTKHHGKLHHKTPGWVASGARFHIRIRLLDGWDRALTDSAVGEQLLDSASFYHEQQSWFLWLMVLMPDHLHAIVSFGEEESMSRVIADWKRYQKNRFNLKWQKNYFDHRLRDDEQFVTKADCIRMNPVKKGLCERAEDWSWALEPWK